jgi:hypothetical protein
VLAEREKRGLTRCKLDGADRAAPEKIARFMKIRQGLGPYAAARFVSIQLR